VPAAVLVPALAALFELVSQWTRTDARGRPALEVLMAQIRFEYAPLLFWYYVAFLVYFAYILFVDLLTPESVKKYRDLDNFVLQSAEALGRVVRSTPEEAGLGETVKPATIDRAAKIWKRINTANPMARGVASLMLSVPVFIVLFGVIVYVPGRILQFDNIGRLFRSFFLFFWTSA
jgi:hypothetical protein